MGGSRDWAGVPKCLCFDLEFTLLKAHSGEPEDMPRYVASCLQLC